MLIFACLQMTSEAPEPVRRHPTSLTSHVMSLATLKLLQSLILATASQGVALKQQQWVEVGKQVWQLIRFAR